MQTKIDYNTARVCAELSEECYYGPEKFKRYLFERVIMHTELRYFDVDGAQAYGIVMPDFTMIVFRGTQPTEFSDIVADIKAWPSESETIGNVHSGFKGELDKIYPEITRWMGSVKNKKLVITGHSLGAGMATLFATREYQRGANVSLYTFGSPRVGNDEWAEQFANIEAYRFVNNNDIVCTVPPFGYYTHVGELHYMSYTGKIMLGTTWYQRLHDKIRGRFRAWRKRQLFSGIYDHLGMRYIKKIKQKF